jgi:hypothetical protein
MKRSASTPNVRGQAAIDAASLSLAADKRRNKLGYHRTSVACGRFSPPIYARCHMATANKWRCMKARW